MKKIILFTIYSLLLCFTQAGNTNFVPPEPVPTLPPPVPSSSTTTSTSVPTVTTGTPSTTHPTTPPTKPTVPPTKPTVPTTPSTTAAPTTTTPTKPTTTTPTKPTPKPKPEIGIWTMDYPGTNMSCIVLKMALKIDISYETADNKTANTTVVIPKTANSSGFCEHADEIQKLVLFWKPTADSENDNITFSFQKNDTLKKFMLSRIEVKLIPDNVNFPNSKPNQTIEALHDKDEFLTPLGMSYRCKPAEVLKLTENEAHVGNFTVSNLQYEVFHNTTEKAFDSAKDCDASQTPGIVPIAVGCSLAALIIIVLIAYLVGRRRTQARGYLSM